MMQRAEEVLFSRGGAVSEITSFFRSREPQTGPGMAALASAHLAAGKDQDAKSLAAKAWREELFPAYLEPAFLARFQSMLTVADHKWRLDRLLIDTVRWQADKAQRSEIANRTIALLPPDEQKIAKARLGIFLGGKSTKSLEGLPEKKEQDWGLVFHQVQSLRRAGKSTKQRNSCSARRRRKRSSLRRTAGGKSARQSPMKPSNSKSQSSPTRSCARRAPCP